MSITKTDLVRLIEKADAAIAELSTDVDFLAQRLAQTGKWQLTRGTGQSSDNLVAIAYYTAPLEGQKLPHDESDYAACIRAFEKLPQHRKELQVVKTAMDNINNHYLKNIRQ